MKENLKEKENKMKKLLSILSIILITGCNNNIIGSNNVIELDNVTLTVTLMEATNARWKVGGTIVNTGDSTISAPWYIEAMFYSDSTFTETFGGDNDRMNYSLEAGVTGHWLLTHRSTALVESEYPNFAIKDLRAYVRE
tara:strand:- start:83 stop:499 length:417 start_codon:yes stop_codon:yes gene_type:complete